LREADVGDTRRGLEQTGFGVCGECGGEVAFELSDLGVQGTDLRHGRARDRRQHRWRDRVRAHRRSTQPTEQLGGGLSAPVRVPAAELVHPAFAEQRC
jgi:hypothetical protein